MNMQSLYDWYIYQIEIFLNYQNSLNLLWNQCMTINELKRFLQNVPREKQINIISELYEIN